MKMTTGQSNDVVYLDEMEEGDRAWVTRWVPADPEPGTSPWRYQAFTQERGTELVHSHPPHSDRQRAFQDAMNFIVKKRIEYRQADAWDEVAECKKILRGIGRTAAATIDAIDDGETAVEIVCDITLAMRAILAVVTDHVGNLEEPEEKTSEPTED